VLERGWKDISVNPASASGDVAGPHQVPMIDVSELPLALINAAASDVLARSLRQVIASIDDPNGVISAFQSFTPDV
jgi:FXSXX-COOH protein